MATLDEPGLFYTADVPEKPHPQCLCFITPYLPDEDEFLNNLLKGDYDDAMGFEPPPSASPVGPLGTPNLDFPALTLDDVFAQAGGLGEDVDGDDIAKNLFMDAFEGQDVNGFDLEMTTVEVNEYASGKKGISLSMNMYDTDMEEQVGNASFEFLNEGSGWVANQKSLGTYTTHKDSGVVAATETWLDGWMKNAGVTKVYTQTGLLDDAYTKAQAGWGWDGDVFGATGNEPKAIIKALDNAILDVDSDGEDAAGFPVLDKMLQYQAMFKAPWDPSGADPSIKWPTPAEIASLGPVGQQILKGKSHLPFAKVL